MRELLLSLLKISPLSPRDINTIFSSIGRYNSFQLIESMKHDGTVFVNRDFQIELSKKENLD